MGSDISQFAPLLEAECHVTSTSFDDFGDNKKPVCCFTDSGSFWHRVAGLMGQEHDA
jgi:hypothetical protein